MKNIIWLFLVLGTAFAGGKGGGGGDVLVCYNEKEEITDIISYDHWNASQEYDFEVLRDDKTPYMKQLYLQIEKIKEVDYSFAQILSEYVDIFSPQNLEKSDLVGFVANLDDNGDGKQIIVPDRLNGICHTVVKKRIATFKVESSLKYKEKPFLLTEPLWKDAPESTKYATVMHELIYKILKENFKEVEDSRIAQYLNGFYASREFSQGVSWQKYQEVLLSLKLYRKSYRTIFSIKINEHFYDFANTTHYTENSDGINVNSYPLDISKNFEIAGEVFEAREVEFKYDNSYICLYETESKTERHMKSVLNERHFLPQGMSGRYCFQKLGEEFILVEVFSYYVEKNGGAVRSHLYNYSYEGQEIPLDGSWFKFKLVGNKFLPNKLYLNNCETKRKFKIGKRNTKKKGIYKLVFEEGFSLESMYRQWNCQ